MRALLFPALVGASLAFLSCGSAPCSGATCDGDAGSGGGAATGGGSTTGGGGGTSVGGGGGSSMGGGGGSAVGGGGGGSATGGGGGGGGGAATGGGGGALIIPDAGTPGMVSVTTGSCATVTPCAGTLAGTWFYTAACADDPLADFRSLCSSVSTVSSTSSLAGRVDFLGTAVVRHVTTTFLTTINLPTSCASLGCSTIQTLLRRSVPTAACVTAASPRTGCDCTVSGASTFDETGTWTSAGGVVTVVAPNKTRTFNTCVTGASLVLRETTSSLTGTEKGSTNLTKQ